MRGLGEFQRGQMKQKDARIFELCQHLRSAIDILEQIASQPYRPPQAAEAPSPSANGPPLAKPFPIPGDRIAYSITDAAAAVGISRSTLYTLMGTGDLPTFKIGKRRLISAEALARLVAGM